MKELETLLGMDLPTEAKELLTKVNTNFTGIKEANDNMVKTIASKETANSELIEARKALREKIATLEADGNKSNNKDTQEAIDKLNREHEVKYKFLEDQHNALKTSVINKTKDDEFNSLNIAALLPSEWDKNKIDFAVNSIRSQVLNGFEHDEKDGWVRRVNGITELNNETGKNFNIEDSLNSIKASGAIDMFLAASSNSGSGTPPNTGSGSGGAKKWADYNSEELSAINKADPAEYERLKETR